jgi:hypothetical protein
MSRRNRPAAKFAQGCPAESGFSSGVHEAINFRILVSTSIFELGRVGLVEELFSAVTRGLRARLGRKLSDLIGCQVAGILISTILEDPRTRKLFQRFRTSETTLP